MGVGNGEWGVGSEHQFFFLRHLLNKEIIKRYFNDVFGEFLLCLKIHRMGQGVQVVTSTSLFYICLLE